MNQRSNTHRRPYRRVHVIPSLLTLGNFACGFFAIILGIGSLMHAERARQPAATVTAATEETERAASRDIRDILVYSQVRGDNNRAAVLFHWACVAILFGMLFDVLDGKVARHMGAASAFGVELDSLADCITFGVAPPVLVNVMWMIYMPTGASLWGQALVFGVVFAICAVLRLARYNIQSGTADKNIFSGLPSPAAAGCVISALMFIHGDYAFLTTACDWLSGLTGGRYGLLQTKANLMALFLLLPGLLMVSTMPFTHLANRYLAGRRSFAVLVTAVLLLALVCYEPRLMLFLIFNGYMALGILLAAQKKWGKAARGTETSSPS